MYNIYLQWLNITFILHNGAYCPCKKPNKNTNYIHADSEHPASIIKEIPQWIKQAFTMKNG